MTLPPWMRRVRRRVGLSKLADSIVSELAEREGVPYSRALECLIRAAPERLDPKAMLDSDARAIAAWRELSDEDG